MISDQSHWSYSDRSLIDEFEKGILPLDVFTHEAHLRVAWIYLSKNPSDDAEQLMLKSLKDFTGVHGAEHKFNHTLTVASVKAIWYFMNIYAFPSFKHLLELEPRLKTNFLSLIQSHYSPGILNSLEARAEFCEPDLLPFD